jgi:hypothetical protein
MTYYRRQRMESFKRAMFAERLSQSTAAAPSAEFDPQDDKSHSIWVPGVLTHSGLAAGQLAS